MGLQNKNEQNLILEHIKANQEFIKHNKDLFQIYEGDLKTFILASMKQQLSEKSFKMAQHRIAPINVLIQIVDKLSKIYAKPPKRTVVDGTDQDQELLKFYEEEMQINAQMNIANELFNLHKSIHIEPFVENGMPRLRSIPSDRSLPMSLDLMNPMKRTHWIKFIGTIQAQRSTFRFRTKDENKMVDLFFVQTDAEFIAIDSEGNLRPEFLEEVDNPEMINPFGAITSSYINRSYFNLIPISDSDTFQMTKLIPILFSDLNFAVMFQAFSIIFGIDVDNENIEASPNAFWSFKSDATKNTKPEIGVIKPTVDIESVFRYTIGLLSSWLRARNIRPGSIGDITPDTTASGISKIIDEMDTFEDRQKQVVFFKSSEEKDLWPLIIEHMHPTWQAQGLLETTLKWSPGAKVQVEFHEQLPQVDRAALAEALAFEVDRGWETDEDAIKKLNPDIDETKLNELLAGSKDRETLVLETDAEEETVGDSPTDDGNDEQQSETLQ